MNQQCVTMWVDKTASSCLVRFSLSYSVGQKVMPTGCKSHWKGSSCSAKVLSSGHKVCFSTFWRRIYQKMSMKRNKNEARLMKLKVYDEKTSWFVPVPFFFFWCFGKCHTRLGPTCPPEHYSWHQESCSPSLSPLPRSRDSPGAPAAHRGRAPRTLANLSAGPQRQQPQRGGIYPVCALEAPTASLRWEDAHCQRTVPSRVWQLF